MIGGESKSRLGLRSRVGYDKRAVFGVTIAAGVVVMFGFWARLFAGEGSGCSINH
jgi:hypothetical protein